ncbi:MAG: hypothetical protein WB799_04255 [Candidatus Sulfotelmatobacter sp.]
MFREKTRASLYLTVVAAMLSILSIGCGSSSSMNNSMSQAQAQAVAVQVSQAIAQALGVIVPSSAAATSVRPSLSTAVGDIRPDASGGCTPTGTGETCNFPISLMDYPCTGSQGGTISVTGDIDGTLNNFGHGSVSAQLTITPANCSVSNLIVNGDPSIDVSGQIYFSDNENPVFPITFMETGGISYGPSPSGSCQLKATYTITSETSCTISGTVCGQPVSGSC